MITATETTDTSSNSDYHQMIGAVRSRFDQVTGTPQYLFTTDASGLWDLFIETLPEPERQSHRCHACRKFVETYGGLVTIDEHGNTTPVLWGAAPGIYKRAAHTLDAAVTGARVNGVFYSQLKTWGLPVNRDRKRATSWSHLAVEPRSYLVYKATPLKTAEQATAERREEHGMLCRALAEFKAETVNQALAIVEAEALYRGEKVAGPLRWMAQLQSARASINVVSSRQRDALVWRAVATAPVGFAHIRSSMVGTLLEDIKSGLSFDEVKRKFHEKMNPLQYRRPVAAPTTGAILQAEKLVGRLASAGALRRRYAMLSDLKTVWNPAPPYASAASRDGIAGSAGVFDHLKVARPSRELGVIQASPITWDKFQRTVLPVARSIEAYVPAHGCFIALVTAADPTAPPLIQWDSEECRNPISWYVYPDGSPASQWGLRSDTWTKVNAITLLPFMWPGTVDHGNNGAGAIFVLDGCKDRLDSGAALFPEMLKSEYHGVRSVIERYSAGARLEGRDEASACGLDLRKGKTRALRVRVTVATGAVTEYTIDRWD